MLTSRLGEDASEQAGHVQGGMDAIAASPARRPPEDLAPSTPQLGWGSDLWSHSKSLRVFAWNIRALLGFHSDVSRRNSKLNYLFKQAVRYDILILLETHGNRRDFASLEHRLKTFKFFRNPGVDSSTGGVILGIRKDTIYNHTFMPELFNFCAANGAYVSDGFIRFQMICNIIQFYENASIIQVKLLLFM